MIIIASEAKLRANEKYLKSKTDSLLVRVSKGKKEIIQSYAQAHGKSVNGFINEAIDEKIQRDNEKDQR